MQLEDPLLMGCDFQQLSMAASLNDLAIQYIRYPDQYDFGKTTDGISTEHDIYFQAL